MGKTRRSLTDWQNSIGIGEEHKDGLSWYDILPEILHIAIALNYSDYEVVINDYRDLCVVMQEKYGYQQAQIPFLSDILQIIIDNHDFREDIRRTCFNDSITILLAMLYPLHMLKCQTIEGGGLVVSKVFDELKHRSSELSFSCRKIICTVSVLYRSMEEKKENIRKGQELDHCTAEETEEEFSRMLYLPVFNIRFCELVQALSYSYLKNTSIDEDYVNEDKKYSESGFESLLKERSAIYSHIVKINFYKLCDKNVADVTIGMISRLGSLAKNCVDLVKNHSGEIAEIVNRSALETLIVGSWLWKRGDEALFKRFKDYSDGRDLYFADSISDLANEDLKMITIKNRVIEDTERRSGRESKEIPRERGAKYESSVFDMAEEVWGKNSSWYLTYRKLSEVVHGSWSSIDKYHLHECEHPMLIGMRKMKESRNIYAGMIPAFSGLMIEVELMIVIIEKGKISFGESLDVEIYAYRKKLYKRFKAYSTMYIGIK